MSHPLVKISLRRRHAKTVNNGASSLKTNYLFRHCKSTRAPKLLYWFKSYGAFAEWVDFAYWLSFIGKGVHLQPAQQAFFSKDGPQHFVKKSTESTHKDLRKLLACPHKVLRKSSESPHQVLRKSLESAEKFLRKAWERSQKVLRSSSERLQKVLKTF